MNAPVTTPALSGYLRADGRKGIRNIVVVAYMVECAHHVARLMVNAFPALDREFHTFLIGLLNNRFAQGFYDIVSFVFHYHYQWDKGEEKGRNQYAVQEHLAILHALAEHDIPKALACMQEHLDSSRRTMLSSIGTREKLSQPGA